MSDKERQHFEEGHRPPPGQTQDAPGHQHKMDPEPQYNKLPDGKGGYTEYQPANKLKGKLALITGGDSGIGRATAVLFAMEGADVAIVHLSEEEKDAKETKHIIEQYQQRCYTYAADLSKQEDCKKIVEESVKDLGGLDILVNNCAYQKTAYDRRATRRTVGSHFQDEHILLLLRIKVRHAAFTQIVHGVGDKYGVCQSLHRPLRFVGLLYHERRHRGIHEVSLESNGRLWYQGKRDSARTNMDPAGGMELRSEDEGEVWG